MIYFAYYLQETGEIVDYRSFIKEDHITHSGREQYSKFRSSTLLLPNTHYIYNDSAILYDQEDLELIRNTPVGKRYNPILKVYTDYADLESAKNSKWLEIKRIRFIKENNNLQYLGHLFYPDKERIPGAVQLATFAKTANEPFEMGWTTADNQVVNLDADQMIGLGVALGNHINTVYAISRALREQINNAITISAVDQIRWPDY